jgi:small subunit ribosomal protein S36
VPLVIWSITGLYLVVLVGYSILLPAYRAPDEPQHVDVAHLFSSEGRYPAWDDRDLGSDVWRSLRYVHFGSSSEHLDEDEALPKDERPSLEDLEGPTLDTGPNQIPQHPPLYYLVAGGFERGTEVLLGDPSFDLEVWIYRLVSVLIVAPLPLVIWQVATRLGLPKVVGVAATLIPLGIPQFTHIGSAVNNDSLLLLSFWLMTPLVLRIGVGELTPRIGAFAGVVTGVGLLTKGFALVLPVWVLGALLLALLRGGRERFGEFFRTGFVYGVVALAVGGWWWIRNLVLYGELSPSRYNEMVPDHPVEVDLGNFLQKWAGRTTGRFWGDFGWFDVRIPSWVVGVASVALLGGVLLGCIRRDRIAGTVVGTRLLLASPLLLLIVTQFAFAFREYLRTSLLPGMQGRYWFGALAAVAIVAGLGFANVARRWVQALPAAVLVAVALMQVAGVSTLLGFYWGAPGSSILDRLRAVVAWAPMPGELVAVGAVAGLAVVAAVVVQVALLSVSRPVAAVTEPEAVLPLEVPPADRSGARLGA